MVTADLEKDERMGWSTYTIRVDGLVFCRITDTTGKEAVDRFVALCKPRWSEISRLIRASDEAREWNLSHPGKGKDWPAFRNLERVRAELLKQSGIKDT